MSAREFATLKNTHLVDVKIRVNPATQQLKALSIFLSAIILSTVEDGTSIFVNVGGFPAQSLFRTRISLLHQILNYLLRIG
jgi:hypothetical protein